MIHRRETIITVWQQDKTAPRDKYGNYPSTVFTTYVRWEEVAEVALGSDGREYRTDHNLGLDIELFVGDKLIKGDFSSYPTPPDGHFTVKDREVITNWSGKKKDIWVKV